MDVLHMATKLLHFYGHHLAIIFSYDQAALRTLLSARLSVCPSVTPFSLWSFYCVVMKFSGVITIDKSVVHAKGPVSMSHGTKISTLTNWAFPECNSRFDSELALKLWTKLNIAISRSHGTIKSPILTRFGRFWTVTPDWMNRYLWNDAQSLTKKRCPIVFQGHLKNFKVTLDKKNHQFWPELRVSRL